MPKAKAAAERALQLNDNSAEAHASLATFKFNYEFDWTGAEREFWRAIQLNPSYAYAHDQYGQSLAVQGRLDEALAQNQRAAELDPLSILVLGDMVITLAWQGKFDAAKDVSHKMFDLNPTTFWAQWFAGWTDLQAGKISEAVLELQKSNAMEASPFVAAWLAYAYGASGDRNRAMAMLAELNKKSVHGYVPPFNLALVYLGMGDRAHALDGLENAYAAHSTWMVFLKLDKIFDPLRSEPRFIALMRKLNFEK